MRIPSPRLKHALLARITKSPAGLAALSLRAYSLGHASKCPPNSSDALRSSSTACSMHNFAYCTPSHSLEMPRSAAVLDMTFSAAVIMKSEQLSIKTAPNSSKYLLNPQSCLLVSVKEHYHSMACGHDAQRRRVTLPVPRYMSCPFCQCYEVRTSTRWASVVNIRFVGTH